MSEILCKQPITIASLTAGFGRPVSSLSVLKPLVLLALTDYGNKHARNPLKSSLCDRLKILTITLF